MFALRPEHIMHVPENLAVGQLVGQYYMVEEMWYHLRLLYHSEIK